MTLPRGTWISSSVKPRATMVWDINVVARKDTARGMCLLKWVEVLLQSPGVYSHLKFPRNSIPAFESLHLFEVSQVVALIWENGNHTCLLCENLTSTRAFLKILASWALQFALRNFCLLCSASCFEVHKC
jgi:hypothetical protein